MSERITHAVSDVGGVFVRSTGGDAKRMAAKHLGLTDKQIGTLWDWVAEELGRGIISEENLWKRASDVFGIRVVDPSEGLLKMQGVITYDEEAIRRFQRLSKYDICLSLFTNIIKPHADQLQAFYQRFPQVFRSDQIGLRKPEEASFRYVLERQQARPEATLFFDDSPENIEAARQIGMLAVQVSSAADIEAGIRLHVPEYSLKEYIEG